MLLQDITSALSVACRALQHRCAQCVRDVIIQAPTETAYSCILSFLQRARQLTQLKFKNCMHLTWEHLRRLDSFTNHCFLHEYEIMGCMHFVRNDIELPQPLFPKQLKHLAMQCCCLGQKQLDKMLLPHRLESLNLSYNNILTRSDLFALQNLCCLRTLDLSFNNIVVGPTINNLPATIDTLILAGNVPIHDLSSIRWPPKLLHLDLTCMVRKWGPFPPTLKTLQADHNPSISDEQELELPANLEFLSLRSCDLTDSCRIRLPNTIKHLNLASNNLTCKHLTFPPSLETLSLHFNRMFYTPNIQFPVGLKMLGVGYCLCKSKLSFSQFLRMMRPLQNLQKLFVGEYFSPGFPEDQECMNQLFKTLKSLQVINHSPQMNVLSAGL